MKNSIKMLLAASVLALFMQSSTIKGDAYFFNCAAVCIRDAVSGNYRYVQMINNTQYYYKCSIYATNGAEYTGIILAPGTLSRNFVINDYTARYTWNCNPI